MQKVVVGIFLIFSLMIALLGGVNATSNLKESRSNQVSVLVLDGNLSTECREAVSDYYKNKTTLLSVKETIDPETENTETVFTFTNFKEDPEDIISILDPNCN